MVQTVVGVAWPIELGLGDGSNAKFPQAQVFASGSAIPLVTLDLTPIGNGMYTSNYTFLAAGSYFIRYPVWADAGHTVMDTSYDIVLEEAYAQVNDLDSLPVAIISTLIDGVYSLGQYLKIIASAVAGKVSGGPATPVFRDIQDTRNVITGVADASGNRTTSTLNPGP
jgi:hypothetical protein